MDAKKIFQQVLDAFNEEFDPDAYKKDVEVYLDDLQVAVLTYSVDEVDERYVRGRGCFHSFEIYDGEDGKPVDFPAWIADELEKQINNVEVLLYHPDAIDHGYW